jgi:hypothetical protein
VPDSPDLNALMASVHEKDIELEALRQRIAKLGEMALNMADALTEIIAATEDWTSFSKETIDVIISARLGAYRV